MLDKKFPKLLCINLVRIGTELNKAFIDLLESEGTKLRAEFVDGVLVEFVTNAFFSRRSMFVVIRFCWKSALFFFLFYKL